MRHSFALYMAGHLGLEPRSQGFGIPHVAITPMTRTTWCSEQELNLRRLALQASALPTELSLQNLVQCSIFFTLQYFPIDTKFEESRVLRLVERGGFEPPRLSSRIYSPVHSASLPSLHFQTPKTKTPEPCRLRGLVPAWPTLLSLSRPEFGLLKRRARSTWQNKYSPVCCNVEWKCVRSFGISPVDVSIKANLQEDCNPLL